MKTWTVTAKRWAGGWELHIDGLGVTQSRTLATAERIVRDYIETLTDESADGDSVVIQPGLCRRVSTPVTLSVRSGRPHRKCAT